MYKSFTRRLFGSCLDSERGERISAPAMTYSLSKTKYDFSIVQYRWNAKHASSVMKRTTAKQRNFKTNQYRLQSLWCMQLRCDSRRHLQREKLGPFEVLFKAVRWAREAARWWMKGKVEKDVVNVAPNPCVLFCLLSPEISEARSSTKSSTRNPKETEVAKRSSFCVLLALSAWQLHRNLRLPASSSVYSLQLLCFKSKVCIHKAILASTAKWCANRQITIILPYWPW